MRTYWMVMARLPYHIDKDAFVKHCSLFGMEGETMPWQLPKQTEPDELPTARLILAREEFDADFFERMGIAFVSEKMRRAIGPCPSGVRYFDIDSSQSAPLPRSKRYQIMRIVATDDMSDPEKSIYQISPARDGGREGRRPLTVVFRNVEPPHEIFHDLFFRLAYCTDEFAVRVMQAGCSGMIFFDPSDFFRVGASHSYRTLRGIEADVGWDPLRNTMRTKLISGVH